MPVTVTNGQLVNEGLHYDPTVELLNKFKEAPKYLPLKHKVTRKAKYLKDKNGANHLIDYDPQEIQNKRSRKFIQVEERLGML